MSNSEYIEKLKDKRWIKKRNKIFKRDKYKCTVCGNSENIQVHHTFYYSDMRDPWKYPNNSLLTACRDCHLDYHLHHEVEIRKPPKKNKLKKRKKKGGGNILSDLQRNKKTRMIKGMTNRHN